MQITSMDSYAEIVKTLGIRQMLVLYCLKENGPMCNREIAQKLHLPINSVTPRVMELRQQQRVRWTGEKKHDAQTDRNVLVWEAVE
jgi:DNA-binding MarR family transcriptional regulator